MAILSGRILLFDIRVIVSCPLEACEGGVMESSGPVPDSLRVTAMCKSNPLGSFVGGTSFENRKQR
jgi:hypothetical protein